MFLKHSEISYAVVIIHLMIQGRIQDLSEGGGQDFLETKNRATGENFFGLKRLKKNRN